MNEEKKFGRESRQPQYCMFDLCERTPYSRGLCKGHYLVARNLVASEETTWDELIEKGKCLKSQLENTTKDWFLD